MYRNCCSGFRLSPQLSERRRGLLSVSHCISKSSLQKLIFAVNCDPHREPQSVKEEKKRDCRALDPERNNCLTPTAFLVSEIIAGDGTEATRAKVGGWLQRNNAFQREMNSQRLWQWKRPDRAQARWTTSMCSHTLLSSCVCEPGTDGSTVERRSRNKRIFPSQKVCENNCGWCLVALLQAHNLKVKAYGGQFWGQASSMCLGVLWGAREGCLSTHLPGGEHSWEPRISQSSAVNGVSWVLKSAWVSGTERCEHTMDWTIITD